MRGNKRGICNTYDNKDKLKQEKRAISQNCHIVPCLFYCPEFRYMFKPSFSGGLEHVFSVLRAYLLKLELHILLL